MLVFIMRLSKTAIIKNQGQKLGAGHVTSGTEDVMGARRSKLALFALVQGGYTLIDHPTVSSAALSDSVIRSCSHDTLSELFSSH